MSSDKTALTSDYHAMELEPSSLVMGSSSTHRKSHSNRLRLPIAISLGRSRRLRSFVSVLLLLVIAWCIPMSIVTDNNKAQESDHRRRLTSSPGGGGRRILYIITTLAEYNSGSRATKRGSDRLQETTIPVVSEGVRSMVAEGYQVDVYLVCHFVMRPERLALVRKALPNGVGLDVWSEATPLGYDTSLGEENFVKMENRTLHLARQHRFVIKDKLLQYDMFVVFEDDMLIRGQHVRHFEEVTAELRRLRDEAPEDLPSGVNSRNVGENFYGTMTKGQLRRMIPGFIRVEVLLDEEKYGAQRTTGPVPVDLDFDGTQKEVRPETCCHVSDATANEHIPEKPDASRLFLWETSIQALGIRQMPKGSWLHWVVLLRGPNQNSLDAKEKIGDYWSDWKKEYWNTRRPAPQEFKYINNQGGWMATRAQIWEWHTEICPGGFLPPYEGPHYNYDGLDMRNVEWYSGGMQLSTVRHACNMQRVIALDPDNFSKSLIYHSANNKQRQLAGKRETFSKANTLLGQLNTIKKKAESDMNHELAKALVA